MSIIYLAGPYSSGTAETREARFNAITQVAAKLIEKEKIVFSPLTMTHPIDLVLAKDGETLGSEYWVNFDEAFMQFCTSIYILKLPGWDKSSGVVRELAYFDDRRITATYLEPSNFGITADVDAFSSAFV